MSRLLRQAYLPLVLVLLAGSACDQYSRDRDSSQSAESSSQWVDSDGDGLSDDEESALGTDDESVDSDGDGWEDGDEADSGTDPLDDDEHPYTLGWGIDPCRSDIDPTGNGVGQVTADFELLSQTGEMVRLYDFCGRAVFMVTAAYW